MAPKSYLFWALPLAGILAAAPPSPSGYPALKNPDFENGLAFWSVNERPQTKITAEPSGGRTGRQCLSIEMISGTRLPNVRQRLVGVEPGATYRWSAWVRGEKGKSATAAKLTLQFYNAKGENTRSDPAARRLESGGPWTLVDVTARADFDTSYVEAILGVTGPGAVLVDDVQFEKIAEAPELAIDSASGPVALPPDRPATVPVKVLLKKPYRAEGIPPFKGRVNRSADLPAPRGTRIDGRHFTVDAVLPPLAPGRHEVTFSLNEFTAVEPVEIRVTPRNRKPHFLTDTGTHLWRGEPFFPVGIYGVYHTEADYALLAAQGFNMIQGRFPGNLNDFMGSLDMALRHQLAVDVPLHVGGKVKENVPRSMQILELAGNHPAVLCWKIMDEPDADQNAGLRKEIPGAYAALKALEPAQSLELTLCQEEVFGYWTNFCDTVQVDKYPLPGGSLTEVYDACVKAKAAMQPWQNLTFVVQCGWTPDLATQPSAEQARAMVYLALIGGAKGISWYSRKEESNGWDLTKTPLWPRLKEINTEIHALAKPLLLGREAEGIVCATPGVRFRGKVLDGKLYLLVCNPEGKTADTTLELPGEPGWRTPRTMSGGGRRLSMKGNQVRLVLKGADSCTVVFDAASPEKEKGGGS